MDLPNRESIFLSNSMTGAIETGGSIDWFPCPRFDSPSIFSEILDSRKGGSFLIRPEGPYKLETSYIGNSLAVKNIFTAKSGSLAVTDFLPLGTPSIIRIFESSIPFSVEISPAFHYGKVKPAIAYNEHGFSFRNARSTESFDVSIKGGYTVLKDGFLKMGPGKGSIITLYSKDYRYGLFGRKGFVYPDPREALSAVLQCWEGEISGARKAREFAGAYLRSLAVVLGLTYAPTGGIIAAATTSLPAVVGEGSNWDYRYVWIRDASYAIEALVSAGLLAKAKRALTFLLCVMDPSSKSFDHPLFEVDGTQPPEEEEIGWLSGNRNSRPVRIGNAGYMQMQMDTEGAFMHALYVYIKKSKDIAFLRENWWAVRAVARWSESSWMMKSTSLWEERLALRHYVHTKVMQWAALDCAAKLASLLGMNKDSRSWREMGEKAKREIMRNGFSKKTNSFIKYYGSDEVDASLLTLPFYDFIGAKDGKFIGTLERVVERLSVKEGLLLRNENDYEGPKSCPFALADAWLARAYVRIGDKKKARATISNLLKFSNDHLLFSERLDPKTREPLGNFPQLFPHAGIVEAILELDSMRLR